MKTIEIYFNNLDKEAQNELLEAFDISSPVEMNWDMFPVTTIEIDD